MCNFHSLIANISFFFSIPHRILIPLLNDNLHQPLSHRLTVGHNSSRLNHCSISVHSMSRLRPEFEIAKEESVSEAQEQDLSIEQEIECPRCHDIMTLGSEFDRLGYYCEECSFSLHLSHWKCDKPAQGNDVPWADQAIKRLDFFADSLLFFLIVVRSGPFGFKWGWFRFW